MIGDLAIFRCNALMAGDDQSFFRGEKDGHGFPVDSHFSNVLFSANILRPSFIHPFSGQKTYNRK